MFYLQHGGSRDLPKPLKGENSTYIGGPRDPQPLQSPGTTHDAQALLLDAHKVGLQGPEAGLFPLRFEEV